MGSNRGLAVVTGASSGIGACFAEQLARDGYDLIVTARREERLRALASRASEETGAAVEVVAADLRAPEGIHALERRIVAEPRIEILVNNAGFGGYRPFAELDPDAAESLIDVHVTATVRLSRAVLPVMLARHEGAIINIASMLAFSGTLPPNPLPARATYAAAKAFVVTFTQALAGELAGSGVKVLVCCPGIIKTEFHEVQGMDMSRAARLDPEDIVTASMAGLRRNEIVCVPTLEDESAIEHVGEAQRGLLAATNENPLLLAARYRS